MNRYYDNEVICQPPLIFILMVGVIIVSIINISEKLDSSSITNIRKLINNKCELECSGNKECVISCIQLEHKYLTVKGIKN